MRLVLIPRGHTIVHLPQSMHADIILTASSFFPLCRQSRTFLMLIPVYPDAVQVALHEPHAMQYLALGSTAQSSSKRVLSTLSRSIAELGESLKPNPFIP